MNRIWSSIVLLIALFLLAAGAHSVSAALIDFNTPGDLAANFTLSGTSNLDEVASGGTGNTGALDVKQKTGGVDPPAAVWASFDPLPIDFTAAGDVITISMDFLPSAKLADGGNAIRLGIVTASGNALDGPAAQLKLADANEGSGNSIGIPTGNQVEIGLNLQDGFFGNSTLSLAYDESGVDPDTNLYNPNDDQLHWHRLVGTFSLIGTDGIDGKVELFDLGTNGTSVPSLIGDFTISRPDGTGGVGAGPRSDSEVFSAFYADQGLQNKKNRGADIVDNFSVTVVPEPASLALLVVGLLQLLRRER